MVTHPEPYAWFHFKPNIKKLILAGAAESWHIAVFDLPLDPSGGLSASFSSPMPEIFTMALGVSF